MHIEMVYVKGGRFDMGSDNGDPDERPIHSVTLNDFYIGKYPVTQEQWKSAIGVLPKNLRDKHPNNPIVEISWPEAIAFCNTLSVMDGKRPYYTGQIQKPDINEKSDGYRLPTEAEWEYAASGGLESKKYLYAGSINIDEVAWYLRNAERTVHKVGIKKGNELGLFDMSGNVYEFCWDNYGPYKNENQTNPKGVEIDVKNPHRVIRGGNCFGMPYRARNTARWKYKYMGYTHDFIGFRIARNRKTE